MRISQKLYLSFGLMILLIIILTVIGVNRVSIIDNTLQKEVELTSNKQRYAINFRGSVHDRAISIRDVVLSESKDSTLFKKSIEDIKKLAEFYSLSAKSMEEIFSNKNNFNEQELVILNKIKSVESKTVPLVEEIIKLKLAQDDSSALSLLLNEASPSFTNWLKVINEFIDYQEHKNLTFFSEIREVASGFSYIMIVFLVIAIILASAIAYFVSKQIIDLVNKIQIGLQSFFKFLNKETSTITLLDINSNEEFGQMAKIVNENILKTQKGIEEDKSIIDETIQVLSEFEKGAMQKRITLNVSNPTLMQLKSVLNNMGDVLEQNINNILNILELYAQYDYRKSVDSNGLKEHLLRLAN